MSPDHCVCPTGQPCACGFAAMLTDIFFGDTKEAPAQPKLNGG